MNPTVKNMDIAGLCKRADQVMVELLKSQSANIDGFRKADRARVASYLDMLVAYAQWAAAEPELDLPESSPQDYEIDYLSLRDDVTEMVENNAIVDMGRMVKSLIVEMSNSQSARQPSGINKHDVERFNMLIAKMRSFLTEYVDEQQPVDLPETNPSEATNTAGRTGVDA